MASITKVYKEAQPALRFIGKKYGNSDRVDGCFSAKWDEWFQNGWFDEIEKLYERNLNEFHPEGGAYIGLISDTDGDFEYWIGIFMPPGTNSPEGFGHVDFPAENLGVAWVYGKVHEVFNEVLAWEAVKAKGFETKSTWYFERCACPRFTEADENGNIVLDMCFFLK